MNINGKLIVFTGIDGSGKTTLINHIQQKLSVEFGISTCLFKDSKPFSAYGQYVKLLRDSFAKNNQIMDPVYEGILMIAELGGKCISDLPSLKEKHHIVISDRFILDEEIYTHLKIGIRDTKLTYAAKIIKAVPDMTFFLKIDPKVAFERIGARGLERDWKESLEALEAASVLYHEYYVKGLIPNCIVVDANRPQDIVQEDILCSIKKLVF